MNFKSSYLIRAIRYIGKNQLKDGLKSVYFPSQKNAIYLSPQNRGITLTPIAATIYNLMLLNRIKPEIDPILRKNQNGFRKNRSTTGQILTIRRIIKLPDSSDDNICSLFVDFFKNNFLKIIVDLPVVDSIYFESPMLF